MNATAKFRFDEAYFMQDYKDWLRFVSRQQRWSFPIGLLLLTIGIMLRISIAHRGILPLTMIGIGLYEIITSVLHKKKWLRNRLSSPAFGGEAELHFLDEVISVSGPHADTNTTSDWSVFIRCVPTPNGLFLYPKKGAHIYIPDSALSPTEAKQEIVARIKKGTDPTPEGIRQPADGSSQHAGTDTQ